MMKEKLSGKNWFTICLFSFMGGIAWNIENMYFNTFLYNSVYANASEAALAGTMAPTTAISRMVSLTAVAAVLTTLMMGTLSDKMKNRKMFISVGYLLWGLVTAVFGFITRDNVSALFGLTDEAKILTATVWVVIVMDIVMTFMGSTSNDAAFNAWLTDITTPKIRPTLEMTLTLVGFFSTVTVVAVGSLAQSGTVSYQNFFMALGLVVAVCGFAGLILIDNPEKKEEKKEQNASYLSDLLYGFKPSVVKENARLYITLFCVCIGNIAYQVFFPYLLVYLQYVVIPDNGGENFFTTGVIVTAVIAVIVFVGVMALLVRIADKNKAIGLIPSAVLMIVGLFLLSLTTNIYAVLGIIAPMMGGLLTLGILFGASIKDFTPEGKAGQFQGIRMIFTVLIPMVVGPAIGDIACRNSAVTYLNEYGVETIVPSGSMFTYAAVIAVFVFVPLCILIKKGFKVEAAE